MKFTKLFACLYILLIISSSILTVSRTVSSHRNRNHSLNKHTTHYKKSSYRRSHRYNTIMARLSQQQVDKCDEEVKPEKISIPFLLIGYVVKITSTSFVNDVISMFRDDWMKFDAIEDKCIAAIGDSLSNYMEESKKEMRLIYKNKAEVLKERIRAINLDKTKMAELEKIESPKILCNKLNQEIDRKTRLLNYRHQYEKMQELLKNNKNVLTKFEDMQKAWKMTKRWFWEPDHTMEEKAKNSLFEVLEIRMKNHKESYEVAYDTALRKCGEVLAELKDIEAKKDAEFSQLTNCDDLPDEFNPCSDLTTGRSARAVLKTLYDSTRIFALKKLTENEKKTKGCLAIIAAVEYLSTKINDLIGLTVEKFLTALLTSWMLPAKIFWYVIRISVFGYKAFIEKDVELRSFYIGAAAAYLTKILVTTLTAGAVYKKKLRRYRKFK